MRVESKEKISGIQEIAVDVLNRPVCTGSGAITEMDDKQPAIVRILEGLTRRASTGDPAAARELREWLALQIDLKLCKGCTKEKPS